MRYFLLITLIAFICACGSSQPIPQWKDTSFRQLETYKVNFLTDQEDATEPHFAKAKKAASSNNNLLLLSTVYLTKYALHTAALEEFDDSDFLRMEKLHPHAANRAYYNLLKGDFHAVEVKLLPPIYSKLLPFMAQKNLSAANREFASMNDSLSVLIACGIWVKHLPYDDSIVKLAIDIAAANGWRRPLWAYLTTLQQYYLDHQETTKAQNIKERLELLKK
ncbi:MAG: hypothetical protein A4E71_00324 [Smithella sp. PtaU1.Bin162]|nr:MAG: hypothetical protein A4E71_00324 [Smithella sp. PtaU1.Bin162]